MYANSVTSTQLVYTVGDPLAVAATGLAAGRHLSDAPDGAAVLDTIGAADGRTGLETPGPTEMKRLPII